MCLFVRLIGRIVCEINNFRQYIILILLLAPFQIQFVSFGPTGCHVHVDCSSTLIVRQFGFDIVLAEALVSVRSGGRKGFTVINNGNSFYVFYLLCF